MMVVQVDRDRIVMRRMIIADQQILCSRHKWHEAAHAAQQDDRRKALEDGTDYNSPAAQLRPAITASREGIGKPMFDRELWSLFTNYETRPTYRPFALANGMLVFIIYAHFEKLCIEHLTCNDVSGARTAHICKTVATIGY
jgi:hypothetical protein